MIDLRISNGINYAVQFSADGVGPFVTNATTALITWRSRRPIGSPELHLRLANGDWIPPTYRLGSARRNTSAHDPDGRVVLPNTPVLLQSQPPPWLWTWCIEAKCHGDKFAGQLAGLQQFISGPEAQ